MPVSVANSQVVYDAMKGVGVTMVSALPETWLVHLIRMADDVVIRAEGLGKKYLIGHAAERERYVALRDVLVRSARNLWHKTADTKEICHGANSEARRLRRAVGI